MVIKYVLCALAICVGFALFALETVKNFIIGKDVWGYEL